jgi:hypothetical protein
MKTAGEACGNDPLWPMAENECGGGGSSVYLPDAGMRDDNAAAVQTALPSSEVTAADGNFTGEAIFEGAGFETDGEHEAYVARRQI